MTLLARLHHDLIFTRRVAMLARAMADLLPRDASVLDVGSGDGSFDALVKQARPDISIRGVDILVRPATKVPVEQFDGKTLPVAEKSFDVVMFVDVLHHTYDPLVLLREAKRVARKVIVLKDHTMDGPLAYSRLRLMDWIGNAPHGVALPYNYWSEQRWREGFAALGLQVTDWQTRLGLYPFPASLVFDRHLQFVATLGAG